MSQTVAILGASNKTDRYSYKAFRMLLEYGHRPVPVAPQLGQLEGTPAFDQLSKIPVAVDTLTMYVGPQRSTGMADEILKLNPRRVIFNPGSENPELAQKLTQSGIHTIEACTLVLLRTGQFETT